MKIINKKVLLLISVIGISFSKAQNTKPKDLTPNPPMGWNSFDSYGVYLHEEAAMKNIEAFAVKLKPFGYQYFVIDAGWFGEFKLFPCTIYPEEKHETLLNTNEFGLLQPSKTYFPNGLQPIIDRCHQFSFFKKSNMLRVTKDVWDDQEGIDTCFKAWCKWQGKEDRNFHIDMDMISFGELQIMNPLPKGLSGKESKDEISDRKKVNS